MQQGAATPLSRHLRAGAQRRPRPLGTFPLGRGSAASSIYGVPRTERGPSSLQDPRHTSGPERSRQEGPSARRQLGRRSPVPAAILFSGPIGPRHGNGTRFL
ncbi:hypothetical protein NDU88_004075 [Pleurodeles waltl]|uniref:Uncharacterized protein n=1 Tax=Pleurodeles waltl TaxID=8319 RepID=A0AAV7UI52_PLEWA|nr:hypothetical protein NDU88_004075 [Pleurodeles waltl]